MTTNQYHVHKNLNHDGKAYRPGDRVSLSEKAAAQLMASGVVGTEEASAPAPAPVEAPAEKQPAEPVVGGKPESSGEPSLDGQQQPAERKEAEDVSPKLEDMSRAQLDEQAAKEGVEAEAIAKAPNKGAVIELISAKRAEPQQPAEEPVIDASANL